MSRAKELGATIVIGDLKGIRRKSRGRTLNRIVNRMPYHRLTQYIKYKAEWESIPVLAVPEFHSPETCHRCGEEGKRISQGLFSCPNCGLEYNADLDGAINIAELSLGYMLRDGAGLTQPSTSHEAKSPARSQRGRGGKGRISPTSVGRVSNRCGNVQPGLVHRRNPVENYAINFSAEALSKKGGRTTSFSAVIEAYRIASI